MMDESAHKALAFFLGHYENVAQLRSLRLRLAEVLSPEPVRDKLIALYQQAIPLIEQALWAGDLNGTLIEHYHLLYQELEQLIAMGGGDGRYKFIIVIPVADRPQHLRSCLESLLKLCQAFCYGGFANNRYTKVSVIIADDSRDAASIHVNRAITDQYSKLGIDCCYFGQDEQLQQLDRLDDRQYTSLERVLGKIDRAAFYHKGASIMRNITYLKLHDLAQADEKLLFYFIDSDQEFRVKIHQADGDKDLVVSNYLYELNQIFLQLEVSVLTGKVVGDPPVSPAVMAGNFLDDIISFLIGISALDPGQACRYHQSKIQKLDDASYHDMADLFGFKTSVASPEYQCPIESGHDHRACFRGFAERLSHFFDGEHPTRKSYYEYENALSSLRPARTVYTGNYVFRPECLVYFIPFAMLKLRMAGPVLGRVIKSELGERFVSANLPMLHKRTVDGIGQAEFRPGINRARRQIDLSGEFERQYFGDVMLFSMERLTTLGYPSQCLAADFIVQIVHAVEEELYDKYCQKHAQIINKLTRLRAVFADSRQWWNRADDMAQERASFNDFIENMDHNFGRAADAYQQIGPGTHKTARLKAIVDALSHYTDDRSAWQDLLAGYRADTP